MDIEASRKVAQETLDCLFPKAAAIIAEGQEHVPMAFVQPHSGEGKIILMDMPNSSATARAFARICAVPGLKVAVLIHEAYMATGQTDDATMRRLLDKEIRVQDLPDRREVVMFNIVALGKQWLCFCDIDRTARTLKKGELYDPTFNEKGDGAVGRFVQGVSPDLEQAVYAQARKQAH